MEQTIKLRGDFQTIRTIKTTLTLKSIKRRRIVKIKRQRIITITAEEKIRIRIIKIKNASITKRGR